MEQNNRSSALDGVKILDFTRLIPGPFGTQVLADFGADIIKVEDLGAGDYTRHLPPMRKEIGAFFYAFNRNKQSLRLNMKSEKAREIIARLVGQGGYDVVIEGFRPGVAAKLGIDYATLSQISDRVITASLPGFGSGSSKATEAAHDLSALAMSGILATGGHPESGPAIMGIQVDDLVSGLYLAIGVLSAVLHRQRTGQGQHVEVAMADAAIALNAAALIGAAVTGQNEGFREHVLTGRCVCYQIYRTADNRYLSFAAVEPKFWINACDAMGLPELYNLQFDEAVKGNETFEKIREIIAGKSLSRWREVFDGVDACVEPVATQQEALADEYFRKQGMVREFEHETEGVLPIIAQPIQMEKTPQSVRLLPQLPGEQNRLILQSVEYSASEIDELIAAGVIA